MNIRGLMVAERDTSIPLSDAMTSQPENIFDRQEQILIKFQLFIEEKQTKFMTNLLVNRGSEGHSRKIRRKKIKPTVALSLKIAKTFRYH